MTVCFEGKTLFSHSLFVCCFLSSCFFLFSLGGGRWADRMTDSDDDEWRKESEGSGGPSGGVIGPGGLNGGGGDASTRQNGM